MGAAYLTPIPCMGAGNAGLSTGSHKSGALIYFAGANKRWKLFS